MSTPVLHLSAENRERVRPASPVPHLRLTPGYPLAGMREDDVPAVSLQACPLPASLPPSPLLSAFGAVGGRRRPGPPPRARPRRPALLDVAAGIAQRYWGAVPCGGRVTIVAQRPLSAGAETGTDAWVTFDSPSGANNLDRTRRHLRELHGRLRPLALAHHGEHARGLGHALPHRWSTRSGTCSDTPTTPRPAA